MIAGPRPNGGRHITGLICAALLGGFSYYVYMIVPALLGGTMFQGLGNLFTFATIVAVLTAAEKFWVFATGKIDKSTGN